MKADDILAPLEGLTKIVLWGLGGYVVGSATASLFRQARAQEGIHRDLRGISGVAQRQTCALEGLERQLSQLNERQLSVSGWGTYR